MPLRSKEIRWFKVYNPRWGGLVVSVKGPGDVYIQTKNPAEFAEWLWSLLEPLRKVEGEIGKPFKAG
jgi:hypothetical protein